MHFPPYREGCQSEWHSRAPLAPQIGQIIGRRGVRRFGQQLHDEFNKRPPSLSAPGWGRRVCGLRNVAASRRSAPKLSVAGRSTTQRVLHHIRRCIHGARLELFGLANCKALADSGREVRSCSGRHLLHRVLLFGGTCGCLVSDFGFLVSCSCFLFLHEDPSASGSWVRLPHYSLAEFSRRIRNRPLQRGRGSRLRSCHARVIHEPSD